MHSMRTCILRAVIILKNYGIQKAGVMLDAPGLILPVIHQKEGRPVFRVTLTEPLKDAACITKDGETAAAREKTK